MSFVLSSGNIFSDCEIKSNCPISATAGHGCYILNIPIHFNVRRQETQKILSRVDGTIHFKGKFLAELKSGDGDLAIATSKEHTISHQRNFYSTLTKEIVDEIESSRDSEDLVFDIKLFGTILSISTEQGTELLSEKVLSDISHRIEQSVWIKFLNSWKYAAAINIELVLNFDNPLLAKAGNFILQAHHFYLNRQWPQAVSECRKALDFILDYLKAEKTSLLKLIQNQRMNDLKDRILISILSLRQICHPSAHGDKKSIEHNWTQEDTLYVIRSAISILNRITTLEPFEKDKTGYNDKENN